MIIKCILKQVRTCFTLKNKDQNEDTSSRRLPSLSSVSGKYFSFSTGEERSAATPDLSDDYRQSPTVHKLKYQLSDFPSQGNKDLPRGSTFPTSSEQIFQMNHLIRCKTNFLMNISFKQVTMEYTLFIKLKWYKLASQQSMKYHIHTFRQALLITNIF